MASGIRCFGQRCARNCWESSCAACIRRLDARRRALLRARGTFGQITSTACITAGSTRPIQRACWTDSTPVRGVSARLASCSQAAVLRGCIWQHARKVLAGFFAPPTERRLYAHVVIRLRPGTGRNGTAIPWCGPELLRRITAGGAAGCRLGPAQPSPPARPPRGAARKTPAASRSSRG